MPRSATGATEARRTSASAMSSSTRAARASGFTLIELLVVVVIVAVLAGALALAVGLATGPGAAEREARRMHRLLGLACERAVLTGRDYGLALHRSGYAFALRGSEGWLLFVDAADAVLAPRTFPQGLVIDLVREGRSVALAADPSEQVQPQIGCVASGEMTPFRIEFEHGIAPRWLLLGQFDGTLRAAPEDT